MAQQYVLGDGGRQGSYYLCGLDLKEKKGPLPVWGWGLIALGVGYYVVKGKKRR